MPFLPGIGPFSESVATSLVLKQMAEQDAPSYADHLCAVSYIDTPRKKCDVAIGVSPNWEWCIEIKLLRLLGDNGKPNDNMLMHILSPYEEHRSALTDCAKLLASGLPGRKAILIYGFSSETWPLGPAIDAFEALASAHHAIGSRNVCEFKELVHPVHAEGAVFGWELGVASEDMANGSG